MAAAAAVPNPRASVVATAAALAVMSFLITFLLPESEDMVSSTAVAAVAANAPAWANSAEVAGPVAVSKRAATLR